MKHSLPNPIANKLGAGVSEADVLHAVTKSGYPLQTIVADYFRKAHFRVVEEWGYVDKETEQLRTLDVKSERMLFDYRKEQSDLRVRPNLVLLTECKQSQLPYVFFLSPYIHISRFPLFAGLHHREIAIKTDDDRSTYTVTILSALGLEGHSFITEHPEFCSSFSKCVRKGSELELSGSESFLSLVSPLLKSLQHFEKAVSPPNTALYFDLYLTLAVGVMDAPMIGIRIKESSNELAFLPWVRTVRHEYSEEDERWEKGRAFAVDIVHKDFLADYIEKCVEPLATKFSELAIKHGEVLASGKAFVSGMGKSSFVDLENRLKPR